jgi:hypothetical protein
VPPPVERKPKRNRAVRRRLGSQTTAAPMMHAGKPSQEATEAVTARGRG